ncbi:hypothetical protein FHX48_001929 [Microbacterium halimionae]|uniref:Uncharacterized protein n=1 Tax=Microbacterium halimionae TaxID=1526413 RepID=A0A7W3PM93_9MICO|nr:hypothetical protein [Microbacterium halimionae]MBA8816836.1 hypothetical protein [Microbacterium halimionae]NII94868.1 hypothetical protein [Microbacterium halimionae]
MLILIPIAVFAVLAGLGVRWRRKAHPRKRAPRNDMMRAGKSDSTSADDAALRAEGQNSWMRMGGF